MEQKTAGNKSGIKITTDLNPHNSGSYSPSTNSIKINEAYFDDRDETIDSIIHEGLHGIQNYRIKNNSNVKLSNQISIFKTNQLIYLRTDGSDANYHYYRANPLERETWYLAPIITNKIVNIINDAQLEIK